MADTRSFGNSMPPPNHTDMRNREISLPRANIVRFLMVDPIERHC